MLQGGYGCREHLLLGRTSASSHILPAAHFSAEVTAQSLTSFAAAFHRHLSAELGEKLDGVIEHPPLRLPWTKEERRES